MEGVRRILDESGVGLPSYYEWRTRSGCYFCFFQRTAEWVGLLGETPNSFRGGQGIRKDLILKLGTLHWNQRESLEELSEPNRIAQIRERHDKCLDKENCAVPICL